MKSTRRSLVCLSMVFSLCCACSYEPRKLQIAEPDAESFELDVYPVLLADCAFPACHGSSERFFQVYGPGRTRLSAKTLPYDAATAEELALSYARARSMLIADEGVRWAPLLRKPLAVKAGGAGHQGDDPWGRDVYVSKSDEGYQTLYFWAISSESKGKK